MQKTWFILLMMMPFLFQQKETVKLHLFSQDNDSIPAYIKDSFVYAYKFTRGIVNDSSGYYPREIIAKGNLIYYGEQVYNDNERTMYVRNKGNYLLVTKIRSLLVTLDGDTSRFANLFAEPGMDPGILKRFIRRIGNSLEIQVDDSLFVGRYYFGKASRGMDSVYITVDMKNKLLKQIEYIAKPLNRSDSSHAHFVDKMIVYNQQPYSGEGKDSIFNILRYLAIDSIKNRRGRMPF